MTGALLNDAKRSRSRTEISGVVECGGEGLRGSGEREERIDGSHRRLLLSCFIGTAIEWYDFLIYGFLAPLAFDHLFFPRLSPIAGTIAVLGVFAVGFAARPIGGLFFAHFGDRMGRKPIMVWTLGLMGVSTVAIGLAPTYVQLGIWAPIVLVSLRFAQGFSLGGESAAGPLLAMESADERARGLFAAVVSSGGAAGTAVGAFAAYLVGTLPDQQLLSWGWRLPFLASAPIFAISLYIRAAVRESPVFRRAISRARPERVPLVSVLKRNKKGAARVLACAMAESSTFYFTAVFGLSYAVQTLHVAGGVILAGIAAGNALGVVLGPAFGALSDRIGRKPLLTGSYLLAAAYVCLLFFPLLQTHSPVWTMMAMAFPGAVLQPMSLGVSGSFYAELFVDARVRLSGVSLGRQFGTVLGGGMMPMIAASLLAFAHGSLTLPLIYFALICGLAVVAVSSATETAGALLDL